MVGGKEFKEGGDVFVIAEAGVNHNGKLDLALGLVDAAADAGADAVKFQTFKAEQVVTSEGEMADYQKKNIGKTTSQQEMLRTLELPDEFYPKIIERCKRRGIIFMSTPHGGVKSVDFLEQFGVEVYKVGSGDLTNYLLLDRIARTKKPVVLSSGMATMREVKSAIAFAKRRGARQIAMLHCTTNYPCPIEEVNLAAMVTMMRELGVPVGYSDHTIGSQVALMGATLGMAVYECHFTLDKKLPGPDHVASCEPDELKGRVDAIRKVRVIIGSSKKHPNDSELKLVGIVRRSLVAARDLRKGDRVKLEDLEAKRPGTGISPSEYEKFIGKVLKRDVASDEHLSLRDLEK